VRAGDDTWVTDVDVALMPMNLPYTMTPAEAATCVKEFKPKMADSVSLHGPNREFGA
jgi:hypothetical protein